MMMQAPMVFRFENQGLDSQGHFVSDWQSHSQCHPCFTKATCPGSVNGFFFFLMHYCWPDPIFSNELSQGRSLPPRAAGPGVAQIETPLKMIKCLVDVCKGRQGVSMTVLGLGDLVTRRWPPPLSKGSLERLGASRPQRPQHPEPLCVFLAPAGVGIPEGKPGLMLRNRYLNTKGPTRLQSSGNI